MVAAVGPLVSRAPVTVVDASVAVKWLFDEEWSDQAHALLEWHTRAAEPLVAPALLPNEVANAIHRRLRRGLIANAEAAAAVVTATRILENRVELLTPPNLTWDAYAFAGAHGLPAVYDALYVVLAQRLGAELWTADQRLLGVVGVAAPWVRWIGDYAES